MLIWSYETRKWLGFEIFQRWCIGSLIFLVSTILQGLVKFGRKKWSHEKEKVLWLEYNINCYWQLLWKTTSLYCAFLVLKLGVMHSLRVQFVLEHGNQCTLWSYFVEMLCSASSPSVHLVLCCGTILRVCIWEIQHSGQLSLWAFRYLFVAIFYTTAIFGFGVGQKLTSRCPCLSILYPSQRKEARFLSYWVRFSCL